MAEEVASEVISNCDVDVKISANDDVETFCLGALSVAVILMVSEVVSKGTLVVDISEKGVVEIVFCV
jgi:hypothetical protein